MTNKGNFKPNTRSEDEYCRNGIHYVGEKDTCAACDMWQRQWIREDLHIGARRAHNLKESLPCL